MKKEYLFHCLVGAFILLLLVSGAGHKAAAQQPIQWSPAQRIPDFHPETNPPVLVADQNRTVHAFSSQQLGEGEGDPVRAIMYNQWTLKQGWTIPIDILLSPLKNEARLLGAFLDQTGTMHVIFFGGDGTEANIYYSKAPAVNAGWAPAWSAPEMIDAASDPESGAIASDDKGNLVIVYSGNRDGRGYYAVYTADGGDTWSDPVPIFLTYSDELFPYGLKMYIGQSGWLYAVWNTDNKEGQGRGIYLAKSKIGEKQWNDPLELAKADSGLRTKAPAIIEYQGSLFVMYYRNDTGKQHIRRSINGGQTWTEPVTPFSQVGLNGPGSFVVDANDDLHVFWGQRITGSPDIHGMWHSVWQSGDRWSAPEAIVSGPKVLDLSGDKAFDPTDAQAVVSQGNVLLVTWRSDPGSKGNGVWYSFKALNAPELPLVALPTQPAPPTATPMPTVTLPIPTPTPPARPVLASQEGASSGTFSNPAAPLIIGAVPVVLLVSIILIVYQFFHYRRH